MGQRERDREVHCFWVIMWSAVLPQPRHTYMPIIVRVLLHNIVLVLFQLVNKKMFIPNKLDIIED